MATLACGIHRAASLAANAASRAVPASRAFTRCVTAAARAGGTFGTHRRQPPHGVHVSAVNVATRPIAQAKRALSAAASQPDPLLGIYLLRYRYVGDIMDRRGPHRPAHLAHAAAAVAEGRIIAGGACPPPVAADRPVQAAGSEGAKSSTATSNNTGATTSDNGGGAVSAGSAGTDAVILFRASDGGDAAEWASSFAARDPYVLNGLVTEWEVREWVVVVGAETLWP